MDNYRALPSFHLPRAAFDGLQRSLGLDTVFAPGEIRHAGY